ncbi:MAG TPA: collagen-like protein [Gemmatimonadaceae bacterium]|nr:collagen-like protein [Gemmatimonadaceae bacterium]
MKRAERHRAVIVCAAVFVAACSNGSTGPQGAQGPAGVQGPAGSPNVQYSAWFTPNPWVEDTVFGLFNFNYTVAAPAITQTILDSGVVLTYGKLDGYITAIWPTDQVALMPIVVSYLASGTTETDTWSAFATPDTLRINMVNNTNLYGGISTAHQFRYVVVPGGVTAAAAGEVVVRGTVGARYTRQELQAMSYAQVAQLFHIPD